MRVLTLVLIALGLGWSQQTSAPDTSVLRNPDAAVFKQPAPAQCVVHLDTTKGAIDIEVTRDWAPLGADRFVDLVRAGYYDDTFFFRVVKNRWAQFGINGDPSVSKAWRTRTIADDPFIGHSNVKGTIAFAFAVPNGRTTQLFFNLQDNSATHDKEPFVIFGRVVAGLDVMDALNSQYGDGSGGGIRAGHQDGMFDEGNAFFAKFPGLDSIRRATVVNR
jgi:peptidyl-prolyl cis-trans isomerase A (cyclophilin A)